MYKRQYLHIPYCFSKCRYCDFYSHPGERGVPDAYVDALMRELARFAPDAPLRPDTDVYKRQDNNAALIELGDVALDDFAGFSCLGDLFHLSLIHI